MQQTEHPCIPAPAGRPGCVYSLQCLQYGMRRLLMQGIPIGSWQLADLEQTSRNHSITHRPKVAAGCRWGPCPCTWGGGPAATHSTNLQRLPLPQSCVMRLPVQGIPVKEAGRQQALHRRASLAVRALRVGLLGQQEAHQVWSCLICRHMDGPCVLVIPSEELTYSTGGVHCSSVVGVSRMCYYLQKLGFHQS